MSLAKSGEKNPMFGKTHPAESIALVSEARIGEKSDVW